MAYDAQQKRIAKRIYRIGRRRGESRKQILAALETGLVESNLTNIRGGDADSSGWRQERASLYKDPNNVPASVNRFYDETDSFGPKNYGTAGQLAAAVQRPAAQYRGRYDENKGQAKDLLAWLGKTAGEPVRGGGTRGRPTRVKRTVTKVPGIDNSDLRKQLKLSYLANSDDPGALLSLASGLKGAQDVAPTKAVKVKRTKGVPAKRVSGGKGTKGGPGLNIKPDQNKGAKQVVEFATRGVYTSGERTPEQNAAVGGAPGSDHLTTNRRASAADAKYGSGRLIAKRLGIKNWTKGNYDRHTVTIDGRRYSVQILEDVEGHYDHTHVGAQRV